MLKKRFYGLVAFLSSLILISCSTNSNKVIHSGHFLIYHSGEQNKPVPPLLIKTESDTTYQRITNHTNGKDLNHPLFNSLDVWERDIENCNIATYSVFKKIIAGYDKREKATPNYEYGTFSIDLMDNLDTLTFTLNRGEIAASFFEELLQIAKENNMEKAIERLSYYKSIEAQH